MMRFALVSFAAFALSACSAGEEASSDSSTGGDAPAAAQAASSPGKIQFLQCAACHAVEAGAPAKVGPNLHCVIGKPAGAREDFAYSQAFKDAAAAGLTWDRATLLAFIEKPMEVVPGNAMAFGGIASAENREAIVDYLGETCSADAE